MEIDCAFLIVSGSAFQSLRAAMEKARSPYVELADLGTVKKPCKAEHKSNVGT